jgi:hypothetical protein
LLGEPAPVIKKKREEVEQKIELIRPALKGN